ncbi:MAG: inositol monophosphatase [Actinobacteria bacterium]|nr:inositol monophosphatase [Actinomycetota bacterium]
MTTDEILDLLREVAAEIITPRFRVLTAGQIDEKTPGDYVTVADREAELAISERLRREYPNALVVGEEESFSDPGLMAALPAAEQAFVIDPVDGTRNFVQGNPDHAVMLAELRRGVVVRGWIWQPEHEEAFVAERGAGVTRNGETLGPIPREGTPRVESSSRRALGALAARTDWPVARTRFCCGVDYPRLLVGEVDALLYARPKPWDHAPASLMLNEVGGVTRLLDGTTYAPGQPMGVLLAAATPGIWSAVDSAITAEPVRP